MKLISELPKTPRILVMSITVKLSGLLSENTIVISQDVADALEEAMLVTKSKPVVSAPVEPETDFGKHLKKVSAVVETRPNGNRIF